MWRPGDCHKELDSGIDIVQRWFTEKDDSILSIFCCELLRVELKKQTTSFSAIAN